MNERFQKLCRDYKIQTAIDPRLYDKYNVKRGLRNNDGSGVVVGLTNICCVHGYVIDEGEKRPDPGQLIYRGYDICDLISGVEKDGRYGFEETAYLLLFGNLPDKEHLEDFKKIVTHYRTLPPYFAEDVLMRCPSSNIMNKMAQSVLALYTYDKEPENKSMESEMLKAISVIALVLHMDHGGGNNSTFTCRCVTSTGTDAYAAYASAISALKGPRHGGANIKVMEMLNCIENGVKNWENEGEVADFLTKILNKEENDHSGLIYGMGHAVYTLSDPRAVQLKKSALKLAKGTEVEAEFRLLDTIERLTPQLFANNKGDIKTMCANVDMYSGLVYKLLGIPVEMYTALFACARMPGWCAHRMEEIENGKRIMRPAYRTLIKNRDYIALDER